MECSVRQAELWLNSTKVYRKIEQLQESEQEQPDRTIIEELFPPFVLVALLSYLLGVILSATYLLKVP